MLSALNRSLTVTRCIGTMRWPRFWQLGFVQLLLVMRCFAFKTNIHAPLRSQLLRLYLATEDSSEENGTVQDPVKANENILGEKSAVIFGKDYEKPGFGLQRLGIDPVRFISFNALAVVIALGANFLGMTSFFMSKTDPTFFRSVRADQLYSIDGFRRYYDSEDKYEFMFPSDWLVDQTVLMRNVQDRDTPQALRAKRSATAAVYPDVAYGPAKGTGKENLSVIKSRVMPGFQLRQVLGSPRDAAERLLSTVIAPPGSNKVYELLNAYENERMGGAPAYTFEYTIRNDEKNFFQHTVSVVMSRGTELYTFTATVPQQSWGQYSARVMKAAESFQVEPLPTPQGFY